MSANDSRIEAGLSARRYMYAVLQSLMGTPPSSELYRSIDVALMEAAYAEAELAAPEELIRLMGSAENDLDALASQYTRCFEGPGDLPAPVWESVYATGENVLFQRSTLDVRNCYRASGFLPSQYPKVADDHVALELDFLRALADRACNAFAANDEEALRDALSVSRSFLDAHLLTWIGRFADKLAASGASPFYAEAAQEACRFAEHDRKMLDSLLA